PSCSIPLPRFADLPYRRSFPTRRSSDLYSAGLPVVRTSPDHGTAFDIAGKKIADPTSFRQAVFSCIDIIRQRQNYAEYTKNPLKDRKSTRLNSSHVSISYAVFCLKKNTK